MHHKVTPYDFDIAWSGGMAIFLAAVSGVFFLAKAPLFADVWLSASCAFVIAHFIYRFLRLRWWGRNRKYSSEPSKHFTAWRTTISFAPDEDDQPRMQKDNSRKRRSSR